MTFDSTSYYSSEYLIYSSRSNLPPQDTVLAIHSRTPEQWTSHRAVKWALTIRVSVEFPPLPLLPCCFPTSSGKSSTSTQLKVAMRHSKPKFCRSGDGIISTYSILDNTGGGSAPIAFPRVTHPMQPVLQRHPLPPPAPPSQLVRPKGRGQGRGRVRSRGAVGRGKLQQQSLLRPSHNPAKSPIGLTTELPPDLLRLQKALDLEPYVRCLESLTIGQKS